MFPSSPQNITPTSLQALNNWRISPFSSFPPPLPSLLLRAARALHAGRDVRLLPPPGPGGAGPPLHHHQPLQHGQADHHALRVAVDDRHVRGEGHPAGDGDRPEAGLIPNAAPPFFPPVRPGPHVAVTEQAALTATQNVCVCAFLSET